ncbi:SMC-Scp complex subunit ScpB [Limnochorda pilosa]|uniref:Segregation and condensation protein B n=1 Tax=Limnochorda pilosa TaxID=1555112 RepID=A0A0K2SKK1_LIMPI|nr:SMC-Scp complex subunit ScpB [Limnochorda pilosa]BAS27636.1 segregation and condensation protein B [Limnochorda pilosa]
MTPEPEAVLEAVLFAAAEPIPLGRLAELLEMAPAVARGLVEAYAARLEQDVRRGVRLVEVAGGYRLETRPDLAPWVHQLERPDRKLRLSRAALECLAIVAYRQPVTRAEIEAVRGVQSDGVLRGLEEHGLVEEAGRKEAPGRPALYRTTPRFLDLFALKSLGELPRPEAPPAGAAERTSATG